MNNTDRDLLARFVKAVEKIADNGIDVYLKSDDSIASEKMALDLAAMKIHEGLERMAESLERIEGELEE